MDEGLKQKLKQVEWPRAAGMVFFLFVLVALFMAYNRIVEWLMDEKQVPLRHVVVSGDLSYVTAAQVHQKVFSGKVGSFFNVDVGAVQSAIESLPWVYRVSVRKKWPDILNVHVTEQQPAAVWNEERLLNVYGEVFGAGPPGDLSLPRLYGPGGSEGDALKGYRDLNSLLSINGFDIESLTLSARFSWQLRLKNGVELKLGREETVKRVQRFIDLHPIIEKRKSDKIQTVDLRYDTGMAVRWVTETEGNKSS